MIRSSILRKVANPILQYSASANSYSRNAQTLNIPKDLQSYMTRISPFKGSPHVGNSEMQPGTIIHASGPQQDVLDLPSVVRGFGKLVP